MYFETEKIIFIFSNSKVNAGFQFQVLENIEILFITYKSIFDALNLAVFYWPSTCLQYVGIKLGVETWAGN